LHIQDRGIGMNPMHIPNIFQIFNRLDPLQGEGFGVGLTLARRLMHRMGGLHIYLGAPMCVVVVYAVGGYIIFISSCEVTTSVLSLETHEY